MYKQASHPSGQYLEFPVLVLVALSTRSKLDCTATNAFRSDREPVDDVPTIVSA